MKSNLPEPFLLRLQEMYGASLFNAFADTWGERSVTFRLNALKADRRELRRLLAEQNFKTRHLPWYPDAFILLNRTKRELMETGWYQAGQLYLQSLASMVPPLVLSPQPGERVLDLTAAPGSKTSQLAALMRQQGELVANDNNKVRFFKLKHNLELLGVVAPESANWKFSLRMEHGVKLCREYQAYFDKVLLDAPCSAEARFIQNQPSTYGYWSERKIKEMAYKQRQLLLAAWGALKPGGTLVYSTCTLAPEENEMQISRLIDRYPGQVEVLDAGIPPLKRLPVLAAWRGKQFNPAIQKCLRIMPTLEIEGFFVAKMRKRV